MPINALLGQILGLVAGRTHRATVLDGGEHAAAHHHGVGRGHNDYFLGAGAAEKAHQQYCQTQLLHLNFLYDPRWIVQHLPDDKSGL